MTAKSRPRVLYLMPNAVAGGAERATMLMLESHQRYEPGVLFFKDGPLVAEARALGAEVHVLSHALHLREPNSVRRAVFECRRLLLQGRFTLLHSCMSYAHLVGGLGAALAGVPAVLYQHGPLGQWMDKAATLVRCDRILVNSAFTAGEQRAQSWRQRPLTLAPYGIRVSLGADERLHLRAIVNEEHQIPPDAPVIGVMARFDPWKGLDVAIRSAAPLLRARPGLRLVIVGGQYKHFHPGYGAELRALAETLGVSGQVIFAGYRADVRPYLARMTVLMHTSLQPEPFGLTIIEAMASGVPVVAAGGGGAAEIVEHLVDGWLYTPGSVPELTIALEALLDDPPLRLTLATAALAKVESRYRPRHMMRAIEDAYDQVLGRAS